MIYNDINFDTYLKNYPNQEGYFGKYGGCYIPDELKKAMEEMTEEGVAKYVQTLHDSVVA